MPAFDAATREHKCPVRQRAGLQAPAQPRMLPAIQAARHREGDDLLVVLRHAANAREGLCPPFILQEKKRG